MIMHSSSHLPQMSQLADVVFVATRGTCPPQTAFSNCLLCATW